MTTIFKLMVDDSVDGRAGMKDLAHFSNRPAAEELMAETNHVQFESGGPYCAVVITEIPLFATLAEYNEFTDGSLAKRAAEKLTPGELAALLKKYGVR